MTDVVPVLLNATVRRVFLRKHLLTDTPSGAAKGADLAKLIGNLGFVQLDSVNTLARAHDMMLWSWRQQYRPQTLDFLLKRDRKLFEH